MYSLHRIQKWFVENCRTIKIVKMTQGCMVCHFTFRSSSIFVVIQTAKCRHVHFIGFNSGMNNKKTRFNSATFGYILSGRYERERSLKGECLLFTKNSHVTKKHCVTGYFGKFLHAVTKQAR